MSAVALYLQLTAVSCGLVQFGAENGVGRGEVSAVNCSDVELGWGFDAGFGGCGGEVAWLASQQ
jgi:hypothetical protein